MASGDRTTTQRRLRLVPLWVALMAVVVGTVAPVTGVTSALAAAGSAVSGVVWSDVNRDGVRDAGEVAKAGITVRLLSSPGGAVVATTTTAANGTYSFADVVDGDYSVQVDSPGQFRFPATASGDNSFAREGTPPPGQPERGVTPSLTIAGATQVLGLDAGMQPIADLTVEPIEAEGCGDVALTGTPPWDSEDTTADNCVVRVMDTVSQSYSVALTGLPTGASVPNVVAEFTIASPDGATLELVGPGPNGIPAGCLAAANGANPPSSRTINPDGSITVRCNVGTMSSNATAIQIAYRFAGNTPIPSHASVDARAFAGGGDAGTSTMLEGPEVEVTGTAEWDLRKRVHPGSSVISPGPDFTLRTIDGAEVEGYLVTYVFDITDMLDGTGGSDLVWPVTFTDVMPEFPNARITGCRSTAAYDGGWAGNGSPWTLTCPLNEAQGADGWNLSIRPNSGDGSDTGEGHVVMTVFIPMDEMNRAIDPTWQPGDEAPTGSFSFDNQARDTDHWAINGGALNFGDDHEPGWNGTGNNLATLDGDAAAPQWDLQKNFRGGPTFSTETVNGASVDGYFVDYDFRVLDLAGPDNVGPWLDRPVSFKDRLVSHPGAVLLWCAPRSLTPSNNVGTVDCETGVQPADGWDMSPSPTQTGFNMRRMDFFARIFIPMDEIPEDPCESNVTLDLRNEAIGSEHWTAEGQPNNGTGFEPGWDGATATGNNLAVNNVRPSTAECGSLGGSKAFLKNGSVVNSQASFGGDTVSSLVTLSANNNRVTVDDLRLCDVFDVSVFELVEGTPRMFGFPSGNNVNPADYVIEYAIGTNQVDTQAGPRDPVSGVFPADATSNTDSAAGCRDHSGPWSTAPAADFGADWQDRVNMVRIRPIDPAHVETGPFDAHLMFELRTRTFYNGGPNADEMIPSGARLTNVGAWPSGRTGESWSTGFRNMLFAGMRLSIQKTVPVTQYLPGETVVWDLNVGIDRATVGATLRNLRVVDTVPAGLFFDRQCTQDLLPSGVTVSYDAVTRQATFQAGDVEITSAPSQWAFHESNGAPRLRICTTVDTLAQPNDPYVNRAQAMADNAENQPADDSTITVVGSGQMGISKTVDKAYVASGEQYSWSLDWGNTSTVLAFQPPDVIDVLPWNGDGAAAAPSKRDQYSSAYQGLARLVGALAAPAYIRGGTGGAVPGTWYYSTSAPATIDHDARAAANASPQAAGGVWLTAAEVADFGAVTAVRFVSTQMLPVQSRVRAVIPAVSTSPRLDNVYVNRAMIFSRTFANQPLLSNEPFVQMPGFSMGDLVWLDNDRDGKFTADVDEPMAGVVVQVRDAGGTVVGTRTTDADGRWRVTGLQDGVFTAHIPAEMFQPGGPLERFAVRTAGSSDDNDANEGASNNNTDAPDAAVTGLTSSPVTLAFLRDDDGNLIGANGPDDDDVAGLDAELQAPEFTNFTVDLTVSPVSRVDIEKATNGEDADEPTGPGISVGGEVRWTYVVTNTGSTDLFDVTVTDDMVDSSQIDCDGTGGNVIAGPLAQGESFTCVAVGVAVAGQYRNMGVVRATGPETLDDDGNPVAGVVVDDEDPSHYFGLRPGESLPPLAMTGTQIGLLWASIGVLTLAGGMLLLIARRRRHEMS